MYLSPSVKDEDSFSLAKSFFHGYILQARLFYDLWSFPVFYAVATVIGVRGWFLLGLWKFSALG